jgi:crotonobetainyl-CoA:carnitine CoA-transferase CaiB-like acyl-CoA transferase
MQAVLEGIRVVEVANFVAAPAAGALLADLGAEVIKVEVQEGELYRLATTATSPSRPPSRWTTAANARSPWTSHGRRRGRRSGA